MRSTTSRPGTTRRPHSCGPSKAIPEVSIFGAYSADAQIATRVELPDAVTANKIKALAGHEKTAYVFARLAPHRYDKGCKCHACDRERDGDWVRPSWARKAPQRVYVRMDIGKRNAKLKLTGGESFVVVAECDVDYWLWELTALGRRGMLMALPLTLERAKSKTEVEAA